VERQKEREKEGRGGGCLSLGGRGIVTQNERVRVEMLGKTVCVCKF